MGEINVERRGELKYVALAMNVTWSNMALRVTEAFDSLASYLATHGVEPSGPSLIRYRTRSSERPFQIEIGWVVDTPQWIEAPYVVDSLPAGRFVAARHEGSYYGLGRLANEMELWAKAEGHEIDRAEARGVTSWAAMAELHVTERLEGVAGPEGTVDLIMGLHK